MSKCQRCGTTTSWAISHCDACWEVLNADRADTNTLSTPTVRSAPAGQPSMIAGGLGALFLLFAMIRWNSAESQFVRAFGGSDGLSIMLFVVGAAAIVAAFSLHTNSSQSTATGTGAPLSAEDRIRRLEELRAKGLISDVDCEERKKSILETL